MKFRFWKKKKFIAGLAAAVLLGVGIADPSGSIAQAITTLSCSVVQCSA